MAEKSVTLKASLQRQLVLDILKESEGHPTAQTIFEEARKRMPSISLATVYRNLRLLVKQGNLIESKIGNKPSRFETRKNRHYHVCCVRCGSLEDLVLPYQSVLDRKVEGMVRYQLQEHRMEFFGICPRCQGRSRNSSQLGKQKLHQPAIPAR
ncbi:MAG: transcriptional repressor [Acidobacteria bacterium]|nr:transcriptional repressor [Acidobacteriota bacterium]